MENLLRLLTFDEDLSLDRFRNAAAGAEIDYPNPHDLDSVS